MDSMWYSSLNKNWMKIIFDYLLHFPRKNVVDILTINYCELRMKRWCSSSIVWRQKTKSENVTHMFVNYLIFLKSHPNTVSSFKNSKLKEYNLRKVLILDSNFCVCSCWERLNMKLYFYYIFKNILTFKNTMFLFKLGPWKWTLYKNRLLKSKKNQPSTKYLDR